MQIGENVQETLQGAQTQLDELVRYNRERQKLQHELSKVAPESWIEKKAAQLVEQANAAQSTVGELQETLESLKESMISCSSVAQSMKKHAGKTALQLMIELDAVSAALLEEQANSNALTLRFDRRRRDLINAMSKGRIDRLGACTYCTTCDKLRAANDWEQLDAAISKLEK